MKPIKIKDIRLFGGWLSIIYAPRLIVWWSTDATPPCSDNRDFPRVHVGRVNSERKLWQCDDAGAESCDGTGWTMGGEERLDELKHYLEISSGRGRPQMVMEALL